MAIATDMGIANVLFHQHFLWQFQKHTTLGGWTNRWTYYDHDHGFWHCHVDILSAFSVTIPKTYNTWGLHGILKNHNLKQESHLNLQCLSIWYFLNPPPPVLFTLNDRKYFTMTSCYSADKYYFSAEYLLTILLNSCTRNNSASANHFCAGSFPPITNHISLPFDLLLPPHSPDLNRSSRSKGNRSSRPKRPWNNRYFIEKTRWHSLLLLRNITLKRKCTKANFFLEIVSSVLFHIQ